MIANVTIIGAAKDEVFSAVMNLLVNWKNSIKALLYALLLNAASIGYGAEVPICNKGFDEQTAIAVIISSSDFKREAAKMPSETKFAFLPTFIIIERFGFDCRASVRVSVDEGDHFSSFREYIVFGIQNKELSAMPATTTGVIK
jgi:hypothetical protein